MKITEISWEDGKRYKDSNQEVWTVDCGYLYDCDDDLITNSYPIRYILEMEFEEYTDWTKVEVDTPVWLKTKGGGIFPVHFAKHENGINYFYLFGKTSHTSYTDNYKKANEGEEIFLIKPKEDIR